MGRTLRLEILVGQDLKEEYGLGYQERLSARGSGRSELEGVRQTGPVGTVLRRRERDVQGLSASHNRQFSTGTPTGGRNRRSGHRRKQYRRLYGFDWRSVPVRGPRPVQAVPRDYATDRRTAIEAPRRPVQFEANRLTVSTPDATAQPRNGRDRSRRDRTAVRRGRFDSICRRSHRRTRETHWSVRTNTKLHNFWAFRRFIGRITDTAEEFGITVEVRTEAWTSQTCPNCGSTENTTRHQDALTCTCT